VVEATSFVSPKAIPQLADGAQVLAAISPAPNVSYPVLVPNTKGMESALKAGVAEIAVFGAASEAFTQRNIKCSIQESIQRFEAVMGMAKENDIKVRGYVSCVMGCPYQGEIEPKMVAEVSKQLLDLGCYEISLGDTIGIGTPEQTFAMLDAVMNEAKIAPQILASHFHNTYDRAIQNLVVSLSQGITVMDSSVAGIGGCPYADGASGNIATEDVVYLCELLGIEHGVQITTEGQAAGNHGILDVGDYISHELARENLARVGLVDFKAEVLEERRHALFN